MNSDNKEILFSVTANDCDWSYTKGTGAGGQKRNKTSSAVHCIHRASGARGYAEGSRSQRENRLDAFHKMASTQKFKSWLHLETIRRNGELNRIEKEIQESLKKVKIEIKIDGKWTEVSVDDLDKDIS